MKIAITGANGYIGNKLAHELAAAGNTVHAIVRKDVPPGLLAHPNIIIHKADIMDKQSLLHAIKGCKQLYHTAAKVGAWAKKPAIFYDVNVNGTRNVLNAALQCAVEKTVFTSTCGVIGPSLNRPMCEDDPRINSFSIDYELSKKMAEDLVLQYAKKGMNVVIVSPSKVYGPGNISHSMTSNAMISSFLEKRYAFIPSPGTNLVCMAYIEDIIHGHIQAMVHGKAGNKYILGGINISYKDFFENIRSLSGNKGQLLQVPRQVVKAWSILQLLGYRLTGKEPAFSTRSVDIAFANYAFCSDKAIQELGYQITPLEKALKETIQFLNHSHHA